MLIHTCKSLQGIQEDAKVSIVKRHFLFLRAWKNYGWVN